MTPKKTTFFSSLCLLEDWIIQEIEVDGASTRELTSDALVLSTMVMASATVSRKASGPRRSTIPAIVNVFLGPGRRWVINNPTPRFYTPPKKELEHDKSSETHLPYSSPEAHRTPGQPYNYVSDNICWIMLGWVEQE